MLPAHGDGPRHFVTLGRLCYKSGLWGKACYYFEASAAEATQILTPKIGARAKSRRRPARIQRARYTQRCNSLQIWVNNDFTMARGWFMGFAKKLCQTYVTEYHPLNPKMRALEPGAKLKAYACAHGERLIEGTMEIAPRCAGRWGCRCRYFTFGISRVWYAALHPRCSS